MNTVMLRTMFRSLKLVYFPENCAMFRKISLEIIYKKNLSNSYGIAAQKVEVWSHAPAQRNSLKTVLRVYF